jgi:hypothetical protein
MRVDESGGNQSSAAVILVGYVFHELARLVAMLAAPRYVLAIAYH